MRRSSVNDILRSMAPRAMATASRSSRSPMGSVTVTVGCTTVDVGETTCTMGTGELQPNVERAPLPRLTFHIDAATHRFDQPADDRESEPRAAVAAIECAIRLRERIEDGGAFVCVDADSRIAHLQMQNDIGAEALLRPPAHDHLPCGREFDG